MEPKEKNIQYLLPRGAVSAIAKKLGVSTPTVSKALKSGRPGSASVQEALRMAQESGALDAAKTLASLAS